MIETTNPDLRDLKGLHLFHAPRSNCSARVRLLIVEKRLPWVSHQIDIAKQENITPAYFAIHPKGLVPTLVHDGRVYIESNDILDYLEAAFPTPSFTPKAAAERAQIADWLKQSADLHIPSIKTLNYANNMAKMARTPDETARHRALQRDPALLAFHAKHDPGSNFSKDETDRAATLMSTALGRMDAILANADWLVGSACSLADISWAPTILTLTRANFPLDPYPHMMAWYARIAASDAYQRAVLDWTREPRPGVIATAAREPTHTS
jgi:glutathione S-transferase